jgi:hypothetical protein
MASAGERAFSLLLTMLVVVSAVGVGVAPSPAGTASAQAADTEECSAWDAILYDFANVGNYNLLGGEKDSNPCSAEYVKDEISEEWNATDAAETKAEIHSRAGQLSASNENFLTAQQNGLTNSETIAFSKGEAAAVEVLANGGNVSEAQAAANESIEDFYAVKQYNLIDRWNVIIQTIETLNQRAENTTDVSNDFVTLGTENSFTESGPVDSVDSSVINTGGTSQTITLVNSSSHSIDGLAVSYSGNNHGASYSPSTSSATYKDGDFRAYLDGSSDTYMSADRVRIRPTDNVSSTTAVKAGEFWIIHKSIEDKSQSTKQEVSVYVNESLGPAVENGNLNATSYVSPATLAQEYAQDYNGSDSYIRALAIAASSGMETPSLENVGSMTVEMNGTTYTGLLLSQSAPNGSWESGKTYDPAQLDGIQMFAAAGNPGEMIELDQPFTVSKITGKDGGEIQTAETISLTYDTTNAAENYSERQEQIRQIQLQLEERKAQATTGPVGTGSGEGALNALAQFLGVSVGAAVVVVVVAGLIIGKIYTEY